MKTSLEISKKLKKAGFEKESDSHYKTNRKPLRLYTTYCMPDQMYSHQVSAYDILNDLCVKYAKQVFGEKKEDNYFLPSIFNWTRHSLNIFQMLQQNKTQKEIEDYIVENSILFK